MKTKDPWIQPIAIIGLLLIVTFGCEKDDDFEGGRGTQADPYLISTPKQLDGVRHNLNKHFRQIADIDLSGYSSGEGWQPIGDEKKPFSGTFDCNGHKIINLTINRPETDNVGLFGYIDKSTIKNTGLVIIITGKFRVGGLVGENHYGNITGSYTTGDVSGNDVVGGLAGLNIEADIINCYGQV